MFVFPNNRDLQWSPAFLEMAEHLPAHWKCWMNSFPLLSCPAFALSVKLALSHLVFSAFHPCGALPRLSVGGVSGCEGLSCQLRLKHEKQYKAAVVYQRECIFSIHCPVFWGCGSCLSGKTGANAVSPAGPAAHRHSPALGKAQWNCGFPEVGQPGLGGRRCRVPLSGSCSHLLSKESLAWLCWSTGGYHYSRFSVEKDYISLWNNKI